MHEAIGPRVDQVLDGDALTLVLDGVRSDEPGVVLEDQGLGGTAKMEQIRESPVEKEREKVSARAADI